METTDLAPLPDEYTAKLDAELEVVDDDSQPEPLLAFEKPITTLRLDQDMVELYGFVGARFAKYLECWLHGKVHRHPKHVQWTYDPRWVICRRTGLKPSTLFNVTKKMKKAGFLWTQHGRRKRMLQYAFQKPNAYYRSRAEVKKVYCLRAEADKYGEPVAILLHNLRYWQSQNKEPWRLYEGRYWLYSGLNDLAFTHKDFLSKDQIQGAVKLMVEKELALLIDYFDRLGVYREDRFWITLTSAPVVDAHYPENHVRWTGLKLRRNGRELAPNQRKTARQNDKTAPDVDKTQIDANRPQIAHSQALASAETAPLKEVILTASVAGAPSAVYRNLHGSLPSSNGPSGPVARTNHSSTEPAGLTLALPLAGGVLDLAGDHPPQLAGKGSVDNASRQADRRSTPANESSVSPEANPKQATTITDVRDLVKNPFARKNYEHHFQQDLKAAADGANGMQN